MKPELPKPKKTLKSFILEEDAKIIDKTAIQIASTLTFLAVGLTNIDDANAGASKPSHNNHTNHANDTYHDGDYTQNTGGATQDEALGNDGDEIVEKSYAGGMEINPKEIGSSHSNHYNHENSSAAGGK